MAKYISKTFLALRICDTILPGLRKAYSTACVSSKELHQTINPDVFVLQSKQMIRCDWSKITKSHVNHKFVLLSSNELKEQSEELATHFDDVVFIEKVTPALVSSSVKESVAAYDKNREVLFVTNDEYCLDTVNQLRKIHSLPYVSSEQIALYTNKALMKTAIEEVVRVPDHYVLTGNMVQDSAYVIEHFTFPIIGKPTVDANNRGVRKIHSKLELDEWIKSLVGREKEVEEYVDGTLHHFNSYCDSDGNIYPLLVGQYLNPCLDFASERTIGSIFIPKSADIYDSVIEFNERILNVLKPVPNSVFHLEFFIKPDGEFVFLEVAARSPGGLLSKAAKHVVGYDIESLNFYLQIDSNHHPVTDTSNNNYAFWCWAPKRVGTLRSETQAPIRSEHDWEWYIRKGNYTSEAAAINSPACGIIGHNSNFDVLYDDFMNLQNYSIDSNL